MALTKHHIITLDTSQPIWDHFFTVAPLVGIGTKEGDGYDLAPKHMATPLGQDNFFGFVCTPRHSTYHNVQKEGCFTVSFPKPNQVVIASLAASPRCGENSREKPTLMNLPTFPAPHLDALFVEKAYLYFECEHVKTVDGFGQNSLICGKITGAYIDEKYLRLSEKDEQEMLYHSPLIAYLAHGRFAEVKETRAFPFPKGFKN